MARWCAKDGFFVQPFNSCGDKDGPALPENPDNVYLLPELLREVTIAPDDRRCTVDAFVVPNSSVSVTYISAAPTESAAADVKSKNIKRKANKRKAPAAPTEEAETADAKSKKKTKKRKKKAEKLTSRKKKAMDKVSTSDTAESAAAAEEESAFTLEAVLSSYGKRKGGRVHMYDCSHIIAHI